MPFKCSAVCLLKLSDVPAGKWVPCWETLLQLSPTSSVGQLKKDLSFQQCFSKWSPWAEGGFSNMGTPRERQGLFSLSLHLGGLVTASTYSDTIGFWGWVIKGLVTSPAPWITEPHLRSLSLLWERPSKGVRLIGALSPASQPSSPRCQTCGTLHLYRDHTKRKDHGQAAWIPGPQNCRYNKIITLFKSLHFGAVGTYQQITRTDWPCQNHRGILSKCIFLGPR